MLRLVIVCLALPLIIACETLRIAPSSNSNHRISMAEARIELGMGYMALGQYSKALQNFQRAKQHAPHYYRVYLSLGQWYSLMAQYQRAEDLYHLALQHAPNNSEVLFHYALHICYQDSYSASLVWFEQVSDNAELINLANVFYARGLCAVHHQQFIQAKQDFQLALDYQPSHLNAVYHLALMEMSLQQEHEAQQRLLTFQLRFGTHQVTQALLNQIQH